MDEVELELAQENINNTALVRCMGWTVSPTTRLEGGRLYCTVLHLVWTACASGVSAGDEQEGQSGAGIHDAGEFVRDGAIAFNRGCGGWRCQSRCGSRGRAVVVDLKSG